MKTKESLAPAQNEHLLALAFEGKSVRVLERDGEPWFVSNDVGIVLDLANIRDWVHRLDDDQKLSLNDDSLPGLRSNSTVISESGLYELVFRSSKPEAKRFRKWVTSEVLPQIRKTGGYVSPSAAGLGKLETALVDLAREHDSRIAVLESHMRPDATWMTIAQWCHESGQPPLSPARLSHLAYKATHKSGSLGKPIGRGTKKWNYSRSYCPQLLDDLCPPIIATWQLRDAPQKGEPSA